MRAVYDANSSLDGWMDGLKGVARVDDQNLKASTAGCNYVRL